VHKDFLTYPPALQETIAEHDACVWALGTSAVGMSEAKYTMITVGYFDTLLDVLKQQASVPWKVHFASSSLAGMGLTRQRRATCRSSVSRCENCADQPVWLPDPCLSFWGRAENNPIRAVEESEGRLGAAIMCPACFFPSKAYHKNALNQCSSTLRAADDSLWPFHAFTQQD